MSRGAQAGAPRQTTRSGLPAGRGCGAPASSSTYGSRKYAEEQGYTAKNPPSRNSLPLTHMKCILRKILMSLIASSPPAALSQAPKVGDIAPDFELMGSDGVVYKTSDFKDKKAIVVAWFPKAFTGG